MEKDAGHKHAVDIRVGRGPIPIFGDDDDGQKHQAEAIIDGAQAADKPDCVGIADEETESVAVLWSGKEMSPPVQTATGRHGTTCIFHIRTSM